MKIFRIILFALLVYCSPQLVDCQTPSQVQVKFADGKEYQAKELERTATTIKVEFLHSHSIYEFNTNGIITYSTGSYNVGSGVKNIWVYKYIQDVYDRDVMRASGAEELNVGVQFEDGQVYFGWVKDADEAGSCWITFYHTHSKYNMHKENGVWSVAWTDIGTYKPGALLIGIYEVAENKEIYYSAE